MRLKGGEGRIESARLPLLVEVAEEADHVGKRSLVGEEFLAEREEARQQRGLHLSAPAHQRHRHQHLTQIGGKLTSEDIPRLLQDGRHADILKHVPVVGAIRVRRHQNGDVLGSEPLRALILENIQDGIDDGLVAR